MSKIEPLKLVHERDWDAIQRLYSRGMPLRDIEQKTGVPFSTIRKRAVQLHWDQLGKLKTPKEAMAKAKEVLPLVNATGAVEKPSSTEDLAHQEVALSNYTTVLHALQRAADLLGKHPDPKVAKEIALATEIAETNINRIKGLVNGRPGADPQGNVPRFVVLIPMQAESIDAWRNQARVLDVTPQALECSDD